jgi:predicted Fe-S protein YdhL (DUF1289 family)
MAGMSTSSIPSPCQQRCQLDATGESCKSCRRTLKEIAGWPGFSDYEKKAVWNRLLSLPPIAQAKQCQRCGDTFRCGIGDGEESCWCARLPNVMPMAEDGGDCLCPACLLQAIAKAPSCPPRDDSAGPSGR